MIDEGPSEEDLALFSGETATCPRCGAEVWDETPLCPHCGTIVEGEMFLRSPASATRKRIIVAVVSILLLIALLVWAL